MSNKRAILSQKTHEKYLRNAEIVEFLRQHPAIACEELLGIQLLDAQVYILENMWNAERTIMTCSRGFGKSLLLVIFAMLKKLLYPNTTIYIVSSVGSQAKETYMKMEQVAKQQISEMKSLKDIFMGEVVASSNSDGFIHDSQSHRVQLMNGSTTFTLNSIPDRTRGKRAEVVLFDESAFCTDELIDVVLPFIIVNEGFATSTEAGFSTETERKQVPRQAVFSSSAGSSTSKHAQLYREYARNMIIGREEFFACDIPCDIPLNPTINGEKVPPLYNKSEVDNAMQSNPMKALREYFNKFEVEGGDEQPVKLSMIRDNETFKFPVLSMDDKYEFYIIAYDPARINDSSIIGVMGVYLDKKKGYVGDVINVLSLDDLRNDKNLNLTFSDQKNIVRDVIYDYTKKRDKSLLDIKEVLIDGGAGGGGVLYADELMESWTDKDGVERYGIIDRDYKAYESENRFPNAKNIGTIINPKGMKKQLMEELTALLQSGVINFPVEHNGKSFMSVEQEDGEIIERPLSIDERIALRNIDIMKYEAMAMRKYGDNYETDRTSSGKIGDDRYDVLAMLAHGLYKVRRKDNFDKKGQKKDLSQYFGII